MQRTQKMVERSDGRHDRLAPLVQGGDGVAFAIGIARRLQVDAVQFSRNLQQVALDGEPRGSIRPIELTRTDGMLLNGSIQIYRQTPPLPSSVGPKASLDPRDPDHISNAILSQNHQAAQRLVFAQDGLPDHAVERLAIARTIAAKKAGMSEVDHMVVGNRGQALVVQGPLDSPAHLRASFDYQAALSTPIEDSFAKLQVVSELQAQSESPAQGQSTRCACQLHGNVINSGMCYSDSQDRRRSRDNSPLRERCLPPFAKPHPQPTELGERGITATTNGLDNIGSEIYRQGSSRSRQRGRC